MLRKRPKWTALRSLFYCCVEESQIAQNSINAIRFSINHIERLQSVCPAIVFQFKATVSQTFQSFQYIVLTPPKSNFFRGLKCQQCRTVKQSHYVLIVRHTLQIEIIMEAQFHHVALLPVAPDSIKRQWRTPAPALFTVHPDLHIPCP